MEYIQQNKKKLPKATEPDAVAKGLQSRTTFKNRILDGRNKKPSPPPGWATIRLGHARQQNTNNSNNIGHNKINNRQKTAYSNPPKV